MDANALRIQRDNARSRYKRLLTLLGLIQYTLMSDRLDRRYSLMIRRNAVMQQLTELGMQL